MFESGWSRATPSTATSSRRASAPALEHRGAVHIYDVGEHDGRPYLAMELVEGKSLRTFVGDASIMIEHAKCGSP